MIYLEKTVQAAVDFVDNFLDKNWLKQDDGSSKYQNISYQNVKNPSKDFREFFVKEQNEKCCYCCREIVNDHTTELEHIIPRSLSKLDDFKIYYAHSNILEINVAPQDVFIKTTEPIKRPPYPHHVAYHNIVASCHGKTFVNSEDFTCCNRNRGDDFVPPFNLMKSSIGYMPDGTIFYFNEMSNRTYFEILNLDKEVLNNIRRLWFLFSKSELSIQEILNDNFTDTISEKIVAYAISNSNTILDDNKLNQTFSIPEKWIVFKAYAFFFDYFRSNP